MKRFLGLAIVLSLMLVSTVARAQDADSDGMPDAWENTHACLNPAVNDAADDPDNDGMNNLLEYTYAGAMDPCAADTDGDGVEDGIEFQDGAAPLNPRVTPRLLKQGATSTITTSYYTIDKPSLVWSGSEFGVAWQDGRNFNNEAYFARISTAGARIGSELRVTSNSSSTQNPSLAWNATEYALAYADSRSNNYEIYLSRITAAGAEIGDDARITYNYNSSDFPSMVHNGTEYGLAWIDSRYSYPDVWFNRLSNAGIPQISDRQVTAATSEKENTTLAWTGSEYGMAWRDYRDGSYQIYFARVNTEGVKIGGDVRISYGGWHQSNPSLVWAGSEYGIAWRDEVYLYFNRLSVDGTRLGSDLRIANELNQDILYPKLAWAGDRYILTYSNNRTGVYEVYATAIVNGREAYGELQVTNGPYTNNYTAMAWAGNFMGLAWNDSSGAGQEIHFQGLTFDVDGDGLDRQAEVLAGTSIRNWDTEGDGMADGWEFQYAACGLDPLTGDSLDDPDLDGDVNLVEYLLGMSPCTDDTDGDLIADRDEMDLYFTDFLNPDTDGDGASDGAEINNHLTDPLLFDTDGDGVGDNDEVINGSNPLDSRVRPGLGTATARSMIVSGTASYPVMVYSNSEFGLAWQDSRDGNSEIYFARLDSSGVKQGTDLRVTTDPSNSEKPTLAWTGSEYGIAWQDRRSGYYEIWFTRVSAAGAELIADYMSTTHGSNIYDPTIVWSTSEFGVSYRWMIYPTLAFQRISAAGVNAGSYGVITRDDINNYTISPQKASLVWAGTQYAAVWQDSRYGDYAHELYFSPVSASGTRGTTLKWTTDSNTDSRMPTMDWTGSEYLVAYTEFDSTGNQYSLMSRQYSPDGLPLGGATVATLSMESTPALVWNGRMHIVAWRVNNGITVGWITSRGEVGPGTVTIPAGSVTALTSAWNGEELGVAWNESSSIYFARVGMDSDGDGLPDAAESVTDPLDWDSENDGLPDGWESGRLCAVSPTVADAGFDPDLDGLTNSLEYDFGTDPCDADSDDDGLNDYDEIMTEGTNPLNPDSDNDGALDGDEILTLGTNPFDPDSDDDGMQDGWESMYLGCGLDPLTGDSLNDNDTDMVTNRDEFAFGSNPCSSDTDGDGLDDYTEIFNTGTSPVNPDTDGDSITDAFEINNVFTDPLDPDTDNDQADDGSEYNQGAQPLDARITPGALPEAVNHLVSAGGQPSVVFTGSEYGVAWHDYRGSSYEIVFNRLSADGDTLGPDVLLTSDATESWYPSMVWTGSEFGVAWHDRRDGNNEVYFTRVSAGGTEIDAEVRVTNGPGASQYVDVAWSGADFGLVWEEYASPDNRINFTQIAPDLSVILPPAAVGTSTTATRPIIAWADSANLYGIAWVDSRTGQQGIYYLALNGEGPIGGEHRVVTETANYPVLAWTGSAFGLAWTDSLANLDFEVFDSLGGLLAGPVQIASGSGSSSDLAFGAGVFVNSLSLNNPDNYEIYLQLASVTGFLMGPSSRASFTPVNSTGSSLAFDGVAAFGAAWGDINGTLYFSKTELDLDGDRLGPADEALLGADPADWDTDDDLLPDGWEAENNCGIDPLASDGMADADGDYAPNLWEYDLGWDPCDPDMDDDGLIDSDEGFTHLTDPKDPDSDDDGASDFVEVMSFATDPNDPDTDDDGISDGYEIDHAFCGINPHLDDSLYDNDSDLLLNFEEFAAGLNACSTDTDGDGLNDYLESYVHLTDPLEDDTDHDGLTDGDEVLLYFTNPLQPDTDSDGIADGLETAGGSNPVDAAIFPRLSRVGGELRVTANSSYSVSASLAWTGTEYGLAWVDYRTNNYEIYFSRVSEAGTEVGDDLRVTSSAGVTQEPIMTWTGSEYGLLYRDNTSGSYALNFRRLDPAGATQGSEQSVSLTDTVNPSLVWSGSEYGVAADNGYYEGSVFFRRLDADGQGLGSEARITAYSDDCFNPALSHTGSEFLIAWQDQSNYSINFSRLDNAGAQVGGYLRLPPFDYSYSQDVAIDDVTASGGLAWTDSSLSPAQLFFSSVVPGSTAAGFSRITYSSGGAGQAAMASTGSSYGLVWRDYRDGNYEIYIRHLTADGTPLSPETRITANGNESSYPVVVFNGSEFGVAWHDYRDGNAEIYFARIAIDGDGDGLGPAEEAAAGTNPADWDSDDDTLSDGAEINVHGTNPISADPDGDGLTDADELLVYGTDPNNSDSDGDGFQDGWEVYLSLTDPLEYDTDGDGLSDYEEILYFGTNPLDSDMDGDGLSDYAEIYINHTNPWLIDSDGDGLSDASEYLVTGTNPADPDSDDDGIPDGEEGGNYVADYDGDGMLNSWEARYPCLDPRGIDSGLDPDGDLLVNIAERDYGANPCLADTDGDGIFDATEVSTGTDPASPDSDGDGLLDGEEICSDPLDSDSDDDSFSDGAEVLAGKNPCDPNDVPEIRTHFINYQGRLMNADGTPVSGTVPMSFAIFPSDVGGSTLWFENQPVTVDSGIYNVLLGSANPLGSNVLAGGEGSLWLQVFVNGQPLLPRTRLTSVPLSIFAERLNDGRLEMDAAELTVDSAARVTVHVAFNQAFVSPPRVGVFQLDSLIGGVGFVPLTVENVTREGFDVTFASVDGKAATGSSFFTWQAFGN